LTALTSLELNDCAINGSSDSIAWAVIQLAPLAALRELKLLGLQLTPTADAAAAVARLSQLTQLSSISLGARHMSSSAFLGASSLSQLQWLQLGGVGDEQQPLQLQDLPSSLTHLHLYECEISCPDISSWHL
jgi:hypothetical protein